MKKKYKYQESKGLPGGPNEMFTYATGVFDIYQAPSNIEGEGMFAGKPFKKGDLIGLAHSNNQPASQLGRMHNHDENSPTMISKKSGGDRFVFAAKDLQPGDELTTNYRMQPELEQPEDFQYGGSIMAPPRKGVRKNADGSESTHLMATETFDGKNWFSFPTLFQNPDGTWIDMSDRPWQEAYEEANRRGEVIEFGSDKEAAIKFGEGSWKLPKAQEGNSEIISLSPSDPKYAEYYNRLNDDVVLADPSGKTAGRIFLDEVDVVADKATPPAFNFPGYEPPTAVQDQIARQTPFRFSPEGIAADKSYQEYQDYIKSLPYDQRPGYIQPTISEYVPPSTAEWWWDKISHPMTSLGYVMRGQTDIMPDRVGNQPDRNAFDYAVDVVNPAAYVNTVGDVVESVGEGDIIGAGIDAISLAPIVPTAAKQGKKLLTRSVQAGNQYVTPLSYKRLYQFNPLANKRPPFTTVVRTQMPGQTGKLVMGQYYDDLANQGKKLNWRQNLDRNSSRRFGYGRGFSSDAADIMNYSNPSFTAFRGYDSNLINPELLVKRLPTSYLDDFMVGNLSSSAQKAYGSGKKFSEFILPIDDVLSAETRAFSKEAYDEIRNIRNAELTPHWFKGFQEVKQLGGSILPPAIRGMYPSEDEYSGPIYNDGMLDEVTVTGDKFKEKWWSPANLATFGLVNKGKRKVTKNVDPMGYGHIIDRVYNALFDPNQIDEWAGTTLSEDKKNHLKSLDFGPAADTGVPTGSTLAERQQLFQYMMGQDASQFDGVPLTGEGYGLRTSAYRPGTESNPNTYYFRSPVTDQNIKQKIDYHTKEIIDAGGNPADLLIPGSGNSIIQPAIGQQADIPTYGSVLGNMTVTKGEDDKGKYISYYDIWDLQPFKDEKADGLSVLLPDNIPLIGGKSISGSKAHAYTEKLQDIAGIKPAEIYNRLYYTENPDGTINFLDEKQDGGEAAKIAAQQATGYRPQATISQYEEPAWYEKAADYLASPMTSLGYLIRGEDLPDRIPINAENRNAYDMAFDVINPAAWAAYAESADKNLEEGNYLAAGFDAMGAIPVIPSSLSQGRNVIKVGSKSLPQYVKNVPVGNSDLLMTHAMPGLVPGIKGTKDGVLIAHAAGPGNNHMTLKKFLDAATGQDYYSFTESFINNPMLAGRAFKMAEDLVPKGSILKQAPGGTLSQDSFNLMTRRLGDTRRFRDLTNYDAGYINLNEFAKGRNRLGRDAFTFSQSDLNALNAQYMDQFNNLGISEFRGLGSRQVPVMNLGNKGYNMFEIPGLQSIRDPRALEKYYNVSVPNITLQKLYQKGGEKHTVASGETFYGIANKYKLDKQDLIDANPGLNVESIKAGQTINLPVIEKMEPISISAADSKREPTSWTDYINPYNWGVTDRDDDGTFNQAFRAARNAGEDEFMWYGTRYNTELEETPQVKEEEVVEKPKVEPLNFEGVKRAIKRVESIDGKLMWNPESTATGFYGQRFSEIKNEYPGTRKDFAKDTVAQNEYFKKRFYEGLPASETTPLEKDANDLYEEYKPQIENFNFSKNDIAVLSNFLGRGGTRNYFGYHLRDGKPLEEVLPKIYGPGAKQKNKTPEEYLKEARQFYQTGGEQNQLQIYKDYIEGVYDGTEMEKSAEKIYDKLNRVYYSEAKKQGMKVPNYIMTNVIKQIDN